jgi:hypothetical protein
MNTYISKKEIESKIDLLEYSLMRLGLIDHSYYASYQLTQRLLDFWVYKLLLEGVNVY